MCATLSRRLVTLGGFPAAAIPSCPFHSADCQWPDSTARTFRSLGPPELCWCSVPGRMLTGPRFDKATKSIRFGRQGNKKARGKIASRQSFWTAIKFPAGPFFPLISRASATTAQLCPIADKMQFARLWQSESASDGSAAVAYTNILPKGNIEKMMGSSRTPSRKMRVLLEHKRARLMEKLLRAVNKLIRFDRFRLRPASLPPHHHHPVNLSHKWLQFRRRPRNPISCSAKRRALKEMEKTWDAARTSHRVR